MLHEDICMYLLSVKRSCGVAERRISLELQLKSAPVEVAELLPNSPYTNFPSVAQLFSARKHFGSLPQLLLLAVSNFLFCLSISLPAN